MLELINLNKVYVNSNNVKVHALKDVNLKLGERGMTFIVGPSGGGKSTLLNVIGGLDGFDSGQMLIKGVDSHQLNERALDSYRNTYVGFVFQEYNLLDHLTLAENVSLAVELKNQRPSKEEITQIFEELGIGGLENRYPNEVSGGQRQRVAIARVLIKKPAILFADEPAGSVDKESRKYIYDTLKKLSKDILVVAVTHNADIPYVYADRIITVDDGRIVNDETLSGEVNFAETYEKGSVMVVQPGKTLNHMDIEALNGYIESKKDKELYICVEEKMKSVETLHPKAAEAIKKAAAKKAADAKKLEAKSTVEEVQEEVSEPFQLVKAKLPPRSAWKLAKTNFASKKLSTIFTILLTALAISFFAISTILTGFNGSNANIKAFKEGSHAYLTMQTEKLLTDSGDGNDVGVVKTKSSDVASAQAALIHNYTFGFTSVAGNTNPINVDKFIRVDGTETDTTMFGERLITADEVNSKFPANVNEIVISDYTANELIAEGHNGVTTLKEVVGTKLGNFTISGIYQTNYNTIKDSTSETIIKQRETLIATQYSTAYVHKDFISNMGLSFRSTQFEKNVTLAAGAQRYTRTNDTQITIVEKNDIGAAVVPEALFNETTQTLNLVVTRAIAGVQGTTTLATVELTGVSKQTTAGSENEIWIPAATGDYDKLIRALTCPSTQMAIGNKFTEKQLMSIVDTYNEANFVSVNSEEINEFSYRFEVVGNAFLITSIVLGMFAILLLYNFVSSSVRSKRKNIGILRAIGAGMKDVFGIFMIEAALLALFILLGSYVVTIVATIISNAVVQAGALYGLTVFGFNGLTFLWMFLVSVGVSFIGYSVPLFMLYRIKPIEIITRKTGV